MKLYLNNFRCFKEKVYDFPNSKLALLKGGSGTGKTTTLEAMRWCLFGNMRNIYPNSSNSTSSNPTSVLIDFDYLKILRTQPPEMLRVWSKTIKESETFDIVLEGESAQKYVDGIFGSKEIWHSSSYIPQGERCPLMTFSNNDKMNLLCDILFGSKMETLNSDNPDWYIQKVDEESGKIAKELTGQTALYNSLYAKYVEEATKFQQKYGNGSGYWSDLSMINESSFEAMEKSISESKLQILDYTKLMVETKGKETEKSMLSERLANLEKLISSFDSIDVEKLNEYRSQMSILESEIASLSKDYLEATTKEQNKQQFKKRIEDNMTTLGDYDVNSLKEENLKEKQTSFFNLQESIKKLESDLIQVRNLQNQIDNCQKNINKLNEALQLNNEKFKSFKCIALEGSGLILNEPSMEILQNTRAYVKLQEVKAREPELLENFGFNSNDNLDKICNELQSFIYEYNRSQTIIKSYNMGDEPISSRATVEGHIASIQKVLDFVDTQKTEIKNNENLKLTNDKIAKTEVELSELNSKKSELITSISHEKVKSESSVTDIISIKTEISMSVGDNLNCPECSSNLEFHSGKLCKITKTRISKEDSLKLISLLDNLSHIIQAISSKESEIVRLKSEKETLPTPRMEYVNAQVYPEDVVTKYAKIVSDLKSISWDNLKTSYEVVKTKEDAERALKAINSLKLRGSWEKEYETANKNFNSGLGTLPETDETYLRNYESELMVLPSYRMEKSNIESQLSTLNSEIFDYNSQIIKYDNVSKLESCIVEYKETLKEKEKELIALRQYAALYNEIQRLKTEESNILILYSSIDIKTNIDLKSSSLSSLKETVSAYSSYEHTMNEYDSIKKKIMEINISESSESINTKIESLNTQINTNEVRITEGKTLYLMIKTRSELEETGKRVTEFTNTQSSLNRLRLLVTEVTNSALQSLVDSINAVVNEILADLFDNTITLELKLFKENKANTKVKPQVNFSIFYNGNTYENVNALSGGEKDRVSLALTLALACVNPSPILFLDECMASLNGDLRENCIEAIKKFIISTYKKTVINICHETVEGYYDEVVSV